MKRFALGLVFAALWGCSGDPATTSGSGSGDGGAGDGGGGAGGHAQQPDLPPAVCNAGGTKWKPGTKAFDEQTAAWGLDDIGALGTRLEAVDFDGDGWPDLIVRFGGSTPDDFSAGGARKTWLLRNTHDKHFEDVTEQYGVTATRATTDPNMGRPNEVWGFGDVDNDGKLDVFTGMTHDPANPSPETSELLLADASGHYVLGPATNPMRIALDAVAGVSFVDYDRDGNLDMWVVENTVNGYPQQDRLYRGDGHGNFTDVTVDAGLGTVPWTAITVDQLNKALGHTNGWGGVACDLNGDGNPELLAASYGRGPNDLWQSLGNGVFKNQGIASGYAFDANQDWTDNQSARCWCHLHPTDKGCAGVPAPDLIACTTDADAFRWDNTTDQEPFRLGGNNATTECVDIDNDGKLDLVTGTIAHWDVGGSSDKAELVLNTSVDGGDVTTTRPGLDATGLSRTYPGGDWNEGLMTHSTFDFDNDGWPDIYYGNSDYPYNHGLLYHQDAPGHFEPVSIVDGIDHHRSHGSAVADFDRDGKLDIVVGHSFARCHQDPTDDSECYATQRIRFFENVMPDGNYVQLSLTGGPHTNRSAIGARVSVKAGDVTQTQEVGGGKGHYGMQDDLTLHFGLGEACDAEVTIRWPDADLTTQTFKVVAGYRFTVTQGEWPKPVLQK